MTSGNCSGFFPFLFKVKKQVSHQTSVHYVTASGVKYGMFTGGFGLKKQKFISRYFIKQV